VTIDERVGTGPALRLESVEVSFPAPTGGEVAALGPVSLEIEPGEFVALVGPSGCGKSTLLRVAAGLLPASAGSVVADAGRSSFVFQEPALLPWRTVERNCLVPLELTRVAKAERRQRVRETLELVQLLPWSRYYPHQLSGGMKMRAALARALVVDAAIMYLDEPFSAIDELNRAALNEYLSRLWLGRRFAALFVTHSISEAAFLAERVLVMSARPGRIVGEVRVPFPFPRDSWLRTTEEFVRIEREVVALLRGVTLPAAPAGAASERGGLDGGY